MKKSQPTTEWSLYDSHEVAAPSGKGLLRATKAFWSLPRESLNERDGAVLARAGLLGRAGFIEWLRETRGPLLARSLPFATAYLRHLRLARLDEHASVREALKAALDYLDKALPTFRLATALVSLRRKPRKQEVRAVFNVWYFPGYEASASYSFDTEEALDGHRVSPGARAALLRLAGAGKLEHQRHIGVVEADSYRDVVGTWKESYETFETGYPVFDRATLVGVRRAPETVEMVRRQHVVFPSPYAGDGRMELDRPEATTAIRLRDELKRMWVREESR